ncbi:MAG: alpha/beta hydrolase [Planctomycetia bacterium]
MLYPETVEDRIANWFSSALWVAMLMAVIALAAVSPAVRTAAAAEETAKLLVRDVACAAGDMPAAGGGPTLDLYGPVRAGGPARPIVLFVHGGGWRHGDKSHVGVKPEAFVSRGNLFASVGYRLDAPVTPREQGADVAAAVAWLRAHAADYGGDGDSIFLIGHSAGAHLAALVATDTRLLARHGLEPAALRGVVLLDGAGYDVPRQMAAARLPPLERLYRSAFGDDPEAQREASPLTHVVAGSRYPLFLLFHVGRRRDSREQAEALAERLRSVGGEATTVHEPDKNHLTLNREFGVAGDGPTERVFEFLRSR